MALPVLAAVLRLGRAQGTGQRHSSNHTHKLKTQAAAIRCCHIRGPSISVVRKALQQVRSITLDKQQPLMSRLEGLSVRSSLERRAAPGRAEHLGWQRSRR